MSQLLLKSNRLKQEVTGNSLLILRTFNVFFYDIMYFDLYTQ